MSSVIHGLLFTRCCKSCQKNRVDGKRKLKCNAVPTIFPTRSIRSSICIITNDQTNKSSGRQPNVIFETLNHGNISKKQNYLESDIPDVTLSTSNNFANSITFNYFAELSNLLNTQITYHFKWLKKQLEKANKKLDLVNKIILKNRHCSE
ncbi:hypothetical protein ACFW04_014885 [Cataglyphis niger]